MIPKIEEVDAHIIQVEEVKKRLEQILCSASQLSQEPEWLRDADKQFDQLLTILNSLRAFKLKVGIILVRAGAELTEKQYYHFLQQCDLNPTQIQEYTQAAFAEARDACDE